MPPGIAIADAPFNMATSVAAGFKNGEYLPKSDPDTGFRFSATSLDLAMDFYTDRTFVTINYDVPIKDDYSIVNGGTIEIDSTRIDAGITLGYNVYRNLNLFAGYKIGETKQKYVRTNGTSAGVIVYHDAGPFAGASYGYSLGAAGSVSGSIAYALFNGQIRRHDLLTDVIQDTSGITSGLSYGVKWSRGLRNGTTFSIGYKLNAYDFADRDMGFGSNSDLRQNFDILYVQVSSEFD